MHLAQHHFQLQNRYFEDSAGFALSSLFFQPFGLIACELDHDALLNGTASVGHARGVMPDGLAFSFPEDLPPRPLEIRDLFTPTRHSHLLQLTIPPYRTGHRNCNDNGSDDEGDTRFLATATSVIDEVTGQDEKPVTVARKNFELALDGTTADGEQDRISMPLARIRRDGSGNFVYDPDYVPPILRIGASPRVMDLVTRLVDVLGAKADSLRAETSGAAADVASAEIVRFWLGHAVQESLPVLRHHMRTRSSHPEELFRDLSRLSGALCTFSLDTHPRDLPAYDPWNLEVSFGTLEQHIRSHVEVALPASALRFPLRPRGNFFWETSVADPRAYGKEARWYLEVRSTIPRADLTQQVPRLTKACAAAFIERLVADARPGVPMEHEARPPEALAPRIGAEYFHILRSGPAWQTVNSKRDLGVYVPEAIPDPELAVVVITER